MSREIDERVVRMKFESGSFEKNIQTSIRSLSELKHGLDFENASKGFEKLDVASNSLNFDPLASAVKQLNSHFSFFGINALNVMNRISNAAIDTGERLIKSLSVEQIGQGWEKYGEKTGAVQTIMAATAKEFTDTGKQMEFVNNQLDKLNWFTDETSYNFVDMVNNIGKFTSNNIALDDSVTAMQGIANWAAISGANANEASRAMYNLSQAMASGSLRLQDWMSIENANMGTAAFKEMAIQSAITAGTLIKNGDKITTANGKTEVSVTKFRDTLSENWLTSDVLLNTLNEYGAATNRLNDVYETYGILTSDIVSGIDDFTSGAKTAEEVAKDWGISLEETTPILEDFQSETMQFGLKAFKAAQEAKTFKDAIDSVKDAVSTGWMKSFEYIFGDYTQAKELWTNLANELYDIFAESGNARNEMLKAWSDMGGRNYFVDTIYGSLAAIMSILTPLKVAWNDVFGSLTAFDLTVISVRIHRFVNSLILTNDAMEKVRSTAKGFFAILSIAKTILTAAISALADVLRYLLPVGDGFLTVTANLGEFLYSVDQAIKESRVFTKVFNGLASGIKVVSDVVRTCIGIIIDAFLSLTGMRNEVDGFGTALTGIEGLLAGFNRVGKGLFSFIKALVASIRGALPNLDDFSNLLRQIVGAFTNPFSENGFSAVFDLLNAALFTNFLLALKKLIGGIKGLSIEDAIKNLTKPFESLTKAFDTFQSKVQFDKLRSIAVSIAILSVSLLLLASIDSMKLTGALTSITVLFTELIVSMAAFAQLMSGTKIKGVTKMSSLMIALSVATLILAGAVKKLAELSWDGIAKGLLSIGALCTMLSVSMKYLSTETGAVIKGSLGLIAFSVAIRILTSSVNILSSLDIGGLTKGLVAVGVLMTEIGTFMALVKSKMGVGQNLGIMVLATSLLILTNAVKKLASIDGNSMVAGLVGIAMLLSEIAAFSNLMSGTDHVLSTAVAMNLLGLSLMILSSAIDKIGSIPIERLATGLGGLGIALTEIIISTRLLPKDLLSKSAAMVVIALAISSLAKSLTALGNVASVTKSLVGLGGSLLIISIAMKSMQSGIKGAIAITTFSAAMVILASAMKSFGSMNIGEMIKSLTMLIATLSVIGIASKILNAFIPSIKSLSATIVIFSAAVALLGVGISLLSAGLAALGPAATIGVGGLTLALVEIISLIPAIVKALGQGVVEFAKAIGDGAPAIANAVSQLVLSSLRAISETIPEIVDIVMDIITKVIVAIGKRIPDMAKAGKGLFGGFANGVATGIAQIVTSIAVLLPSLVGSMRMLSGAKGMEKGASKTLFLMIGIVGSIGLLLIAFSNIPMGDVSSAINIAAGIALLLPILSGCFAVLSITKADISNGALARFGIFSAIVVAIGALVALVGGIRGVENAITVASSIAVLLPTLAATVGILSVIPFGPDSLKRIAMLSVGMDIVVAVVGALLVGVGALADNFAGFGSALEKTPYYCKILGEAIGNFIGYLLGGIAGGALAGLASSWPLVCGALSLGMQQLQPFFDTLKEIPGGGVELVGTLIGMILALTAAEFMSGLKALPGIGTLLAIGTATLPADFASFGLALKAFGDSLGDTDVAKVKTAAEAVEILSTLENGLPTSGGSLTTWIFGNKSLAEFGERLKQFGDAIMQFASSVSGLNPEVVTAAAESGKALAELENALPASGSTIEKWFFGEKDLGAFGEKLNLFGYGLSLFQGWVRNLDSTIVDNAINAGMALANLENTLPKQDGVLQAWLGSQSLDDFGSRLETFGSALVTFSETVAGNISLYAIGAAVNAATKLAELEKNLDTTGGLGSIFYGDSSFKTFGKNVTSLGDGIVAFSSKVTGIDLSKMASAVSWVKSLVDLTGIDSASDRIKNNTVYLMRKIKEIIDNNRTILEEKGKNIAKWVVSGFSNGIEHYLYLAEKAATKLGNRVAQATRDALEIASPSAVMEEVGKWTVRGLADGITKDMSAEQAAEKKAENIISAFQNALGKLNTKLDISNLEYELWTRTEGKTATEDEKGRKQLDLEIEKLKAKAQEVSMMRTAMNAVLETAGEESDAYMTAYKNYLQAQNDMYDQQASVEELKKTVLQNSNTTWAQQAQKFAQLQKDNAEAFKFMGKSEEDLRKWAAEQVGSGFERQLETNALLEEYRDAFDRLGYSQQQRIAEVDKMLGPETAKEIENKAYDTSVIVKQAMEETSYTLEQTVTKSVSGAITKGVSTAVEQSNGAIASSGEETGSSFDQGVSKGITDNSGTIQDACYNSLSRVKDWGMEAINAHSPSRDGIEIGMWFMKGIASGLSENEPMLLNISTSISNGAIAPFEKRIPEYRQIGVQSMVGFARGIREKGSEAIALATEIANEVAAKMRQALDINSPSKVTEAIGSYVSQGLAIGMLNKKSLVIDSAEEVANSTVTALGYTKDLINDVLANDEDFSPTITPVLDLDQLTQDAKSIPNLLSRKSTLNLSATARRANQLNANITQNRQNGTDLPGQTNYTFTQNNYSPKALNRLEIYRQTQNQFAQLKGATKIR